MKRATGLQFLRDDRKYTVLNLRMTEATHQKRFFRGPRVAGVVYVTATFPTVFLLKQASYLPSANLPSYTKTLDRQMGDSHFP